jgi:hypothetical protein
LAGVETFKEMRMNILKFRWIVLATVGSICLASWAAVCAGFFVRFTLRVWTGIVTVAAISTEMLFWSLAAALGVTVIQARHRLWAWALSPMRRHRRFRAEQRSKIDDA